MAKALGYYEEIQLGVDKKDHMFGMMDKMNKMRMEKRGCDLTVKVDGKEILVHRNVMMAGSDFFDAMFTHDMQEKQSGVVEMKDVSFRIFKKCVEFIYTGDISLVLGECEELLFIAGMLQLTSVCNNIAPFLETHLSLSSFFATKRIADKFSMKNLKKICDDFALKNLSKIVKEKEFDSLEKEYISFLITTKKSGGVVSEDLKMAVMLQWIKADVESRKQHLIDLAALLDFQKVSAGLGKHLAIKEQVCNQSPEFMKMLFLASINDSSVECKSLEALFKSSEEKSVMVVDQSANVLRAYNPSTKNWIKMQDLHEDISMYSSWFTAVVMDNFLYVLLGNKKAFKLNMKGKGSKWKIIPSMNQEHTAPIAAVCGGEVYVVDSYSMERYRAGEDEWKEVDCTGISNSNGCALAAYGSYIYTIGGYADGQYLSDVNRYSPVTSTWSSMTPMPICHQYAATTVHDDKILVAGGCYDGINVSNLMSFVPRVNAWTKLSPMLNGRHYFGLCTVANRLYAVGKYNSGCSIEMYDFEEGNWSILADEDEDMEIMAPATVSIVLPDT